MKVSSFSTMIILLTISSILFIQPIQCARPNQDLVLEICQKSPNYSLCLITLKSNLNTHHLDSNANDVSGFARITLEVIAARAPLILRQLQNVDAQTDHTQLKSCVDSCITSYTKISNELMPQALDFVDKGNLNGAKENAAQAGNLADSCEKNCNGSTSTAVSPIGDGNQYVQDMCAITVSMITNFPQSNHQTLA
jgi:pectinesterase inhibitor-like protein